MPTLTTNYSLKKPLVNNATDADLWGGFLNDNMDDIDEELKDTSDRVAALEASVSALTTLVNSSLEVPGVIKEWASSTSVPSGYLECNGQSVSRTTYAALFAVIGTQHGADSGDTFKVPDRRDKFVRGWNGVRSMNDVQQDAFQGHEHRLYVEGGAGGSSVIDYEARLQGNYGTQGIIDGGYGTPRIATETRPINVPTRWIIKT